MQALFNSFHNVAKQFMEWFYQKFEVAKVS